jgi:hypothetical protein
MIKIVVLIFALHRSLWIIRTGIMHDALTVALSTVWREPNNTLTGTFEGLLFAEAT